MWIQPYVVMETPEKNGSQVVNTMILMLQVRMKIIKVRFHDVLDAMESVRHGALEGSTSILYDKRKLLLGKGPPWENEIHSILIRREYLYLIIARKSIHK